MSVQLASQDFATPDKGGPNNMTVSTVDGNDYQQQQKAAPATASNAPDAQTSTSMTPMEAGQKDSNNKNSNQRLNAVTPHGSHPGTSGKQVRFGADETSHGKPLSSESLATAVSNNRSGVPVSRRGGRFVSPARSMVANTSTPASSSDGESKAAASEMTPKEHSVLEYQTFQNDSTPSLRSTNSVGLVSMPSESEKETDGKVKSEGELVVDSRRPTSISYGSSNVQASPLTKTSPQKDCPSFDDEAKSLIRSPVPSQSYDRVKKTPTKSPGQFQTLPSLDDAQLQSPGGIFLSPHPPTPQPLNSGKGSEKDEEKEEKKDDSNQDKFRDYSKDKFALTPTNFSMDYGKGNFGAFDTSNVLNWLQSPTANGLFSPGGGLNSIMNTPKGPIMPRTPGTPTMSQSFFFSDVASLARENTPQRGEPDAVKSAKKGLSNIICISPLASSRNRNGNPHQANTPINYHDIFASPNPLLEDSPVKAMLRARGGGNGQQQNGKNIDAVDMAERDLMQDEDLNVLLQLAGGNTPKAVKVAAGGHVFRGAGSGQGSKKENLPGLQLPVIGDMEGDSSAARLSRKSHSRDTGESGGFVAPHLSIRQTDSTGAQSKDSNGSKSDVKADPPTSKLAPRTDSKAKPSPSSNGKPPVGQGYTKVHAASYPPRPHSQEMYGFPSMLPHGMRPSGRMSVVVGGPPPSSRAPKPSPGQARHPHRPPPGYSHEYPPPGMSYPPPPGHYPHHPVHMGAHPYHYGAPHHPPQRMPLYGQPPSSSHGSAAPSSSSKKDSKPAAAPKAKAPQKRPLPVSSGPPPAKKRKGSSPNGKRKPKSSPAPERVDRQKAAQSIASMNAASGGKNDKAAALAAAILRGVTMRPSGKWQAQLYFAGKSRYIGVFDTREKAALAYEIAREKLKAHKDAADGPLTPKQTENAVNAARKAAFDGVNEKDPRIS